jgi:phenylalanyl-tRNA synthetase beta chain
MNVSYRWLKSLLPELSQTPEETAETLALRGAPVEEMVNLAPGLEDLVIGQVESVSRHPNADRLSVCEVNTGSETVQVVCGAPIVEEGAFYPFAPVGSSLPNGMKLKAVKLRGVESQGMLCSEAELELGADAAGIMKLEGTFEPGGSFLGALGLNDWRMDVEITANRGDLLSHIGIARELAVAGGQGVVLPPLPSGSGRGGYDTDWPDADTPLDLEAHPEEASADGVSVRIEDPELCSRYLGAVVRGVKVGPSPEWLASRLRAAGSRPINNVVDATNFVLLELGQPLHAFDLNKLGERRIVVRQARSGETITTLDGESRKLEPGMLAICDAAEPVAIAGVMGGADSEVSEGTQDILLECALFDPKSVRATRNALGMSTDASYRFERGVDPAGLERAVQRAVEIILATAGGSPDPKVLDAAPKPWDGLTVPLRLSRVPKLLGIELSEEEIRELIEPLGFSVGPIEGETLPVSVPGFRSYDVQREVDLLEEVARTYGFDRFPEDLRPFRPGSVPDHPLFQVEDELRDLLVGEGFLEAQTMAFAPEGEGEEELSNPVSAEEGFLRSSLLPGLIRRVAYNFARGIRDVRLFELGTVFFGRGSEDRPAEETRLCVVMTGAQAPHHWAREAVSVDVWYLKGLLGRVLPAARLPGALVADEERGSAPFAEGSVGGLVVRAGDDEVGRAGMIDSSSVDSPAWAGPVWALELTVPADPEPRPVTVFEPLPPFPGVDRDLALVVPTDVAAGAVGDTIRSSAGPLLVDLAVFDLYEGEGVPAGFRSLAFRLRYQSADRTLTDKDVERSVKRVTARLREELGVEPRG